MINSIISIDYNPIYQCTVNDLILISPTSSSLILVSQIINNLDDCLILNATAQYTYAAKNFLIKQYKKLQLYLYLKSTNAFISYIYKEIAFV